MKKKQLSLEEHQKYLYEILYMIDDFCTKYNISYILHSGSLLGAVRHGTIIPWDDDVDIAMPRPDYERFVKLFREKTPSGYRIYDFFHEGWYDYPFAKIEKSNTFFREGFFKQKAMGIFVDIFIIDGCGNELKAAQDYYMNLALPIFNTQLLYCGNPRVNFDMWKSKIVYYCTIFPIMLLNPIKKWYLRNLYSKAEHYSFENSDFCGNIVCGRQIGEVQPKTCFTDLIRLPFGKRTLPVPRMYDTYLKGLYGDYMTPLPPEQRSHHGTGVSYLLVDDE